MMKEKLEVVDIDVYICLNQNPDSLGIELLDKFNDCNIYTLCNDLHLNTKQTSALKEAQKNIKTFKELANIPSIGGITYKKLFNHFRSNTFTEQLTLP